MKLAAVGLVAVTLSTTALTPAAGTPPWPVTCNVTEPPGPIFAAGAPNPDRVSINRAGCTAVNPSPVGHHPLTSTMRSTVPALLYRMTWPVSDSLTTTRLGMVWPVTTLRLEARGRVAPGG